MNTIIRAHIKNQKRLDTLEREFKSWEDKDLWNFGNLYVIDDHSPMSEELFNLCSRCNVEYGKAGSDKGDTKNGLYYSLLESADLGNNEDLYCVDDMVFGKGIADRLARFWKEEQYIVHNRGLIGFFACYENITRNKCKVVGTDLWLEPWDIFYGMVCHMISVPLRDTLIMEWQKVLNGQSPYPQMCDDLWVKEICKKYQYPIFNTMMDYAQHTGGDNRTFGESGENSDYKTLLFVGE